VKPSSLTPLALLAACVAGAACKSGPDPSQTGGEVDSVQVAQLSNGLDFVGSAVVDTGVVFVAANESLSSVRFSPDVVLPSLWPSLGTAAELELAAGAGGTLWWASNDGVTSALWKLPETSFVDGQIATRTPFPGGGASDVVGLVADATSVWAAVATPETPNAGGEIWPDSWQWPGAEQVYTPYKGDIYQITAGQPPVALAVAQPINFFPGLMVHVLAQSTTSIYWVDSTHTGTDLARVMSATKTPSATPPGQRVAGVPAMDNGLAVGIVGLAASDKLVAWAAAPFPSPGTDGCWIWVTTPTGAPLEIYNSDAEPTPFTCSGLAIDDQYAYFAMVSTTNLQSPVLVGTGIGRVPLAGGLLQTAPLQSDRWYGPRRVLVDATYVYALDPSYVLRFPKDLFQ